MEGLLEIVRLRKFFVVCVFVWGLVLTAKPDIIHNPIEA